MRLSPETIAAHRAKHARETRYPQHTLAPDPHQRDLPLQPPCPTRKILADSCPSCGSIHTSRAEAFACRDGN